MDKWTEEAIDRLIEREGGFVDDSDDRGQATKFGISKRSYPTLDIANLTLDQARQIYYHDYFRATHIDRIGFAPLREQLFDFAVNSGAPQAIRCLQRLVGVSPDGLLGPKTIDAVDTFPDQKALNNFLVDARQAFIDKLVRLRPRLAKFERGWTRRLTSFRLA